MKNYANYRFPPGPCSKWLGPEAVYWAMTCSSVCSLGGPSYLRQQMNRAVDPEQYQFGEGVQLFHQSSVPFHFFIKSPVKVWLCA